MMGSGKGLPGGGPWVVLDDCEAPKHNTLRAHAGRHGREGSRTARCRCPGAVASYRGDLARRTRLEQFRRAPKPIVPGTLPPLPLPPPRLTGAPCKTENGAALVDLWQRSVGHGQHRVGVAVKWMCDRRCPVRDQCEFWVQVSEKPAGGWPGIYAGRTAAERERAAAKRAMLQDASKLEPCWRIAHRVAILRDRAWSWPGPKRSDLCSDLPVQPRER